MTLFYNIQPLKADIVFRQGDTINISFDVYMNGVLFDMTGMQIDIKFKRKDGLLIKNYSSAGLLPAITILASRYTLYDVNGFDGIYVLDYDVQLKSGLNYYTIQEGEAIVKKQIT